MAARGRGAAARVRGGVAFAEIGLDLDDAGDAFAVARHQQLAEQVVSHRNGRPPVERAGQRRQQRISH